MTRSNTRSGSIGPRTTNSWATSPCRSSMTPHSRATPRTSIPAATPTAPFADDEEDDNGLPKVVSIRTGGGWDVTLTLPDGGRTTFAFNPHYRSDDSTAMAYWDAPPGVTAKLEPLDTGVINFLYTQPPF